MNVSAKELLYFTSSEEIKNIGPEVDCIFFSVGAIQEFEEMQYDQKMKYIEDKVKNYKKEYYEKYRKIKVIKGGG